MNLTKIKITVLEARYMKRRYLLGLLVAIAGLLVLATSCTPAQPFFGGSGQQSNPYGGMGQGMMGSGMMGGQGGMMGGMMGSDMMGGMMGSGMMGYYAEVSAPLAHGNAKAIADRYLASIGNPDLKIGEFEEYSHNFYLSLVEKSTGRGALEVIIDRYSGTPQPEPPSMMWNSKYAMMGNLQGAPMTVTSAQALKTAQEFLDWAYPGTEAGDILSYYGYYTVMTHWRGEHYGMLSVNGYSGDVWYHTWHGMFISEVEE